ncbi:DUF885 domain-containing protein [Cellulomonas shaoxiangyii]|uniref:DUF885 domain-containing protein n=1 Tax=Cellulomonas shaoxiangyii TaxID=2566013 RepID=A0A4P7SLU6_9CELL|nr:DUF885 domain-containing protein [Cellulomonas shaoxiangyii]QCB93553.1 DUF885 domain-containing protein [Cellulomonas shaoxiangyii]TGY86875.1 DUF885 domain-containing protein [Cellulomonas shaoxiangyii]
MVTSPPSPSAPTARQVADRWVETLADLDPTVGTALGTRPDDRRMPDLSPAGAEEKAAASRRVLVELDASQVLDDDDRRCATLLRERLEAQLAVHEAGEHLAALRPLASPVHALQSVFLMMPTATAHDWDVVADRMAQVPAAADGFRASLEEGLRRGVRSAPRQAEAVVGQLGDWLAAGDGRGWHAGFVTGAEAAGVGDALRGRLDGAAVAAADGVERLRAWIAERYLPAVGDVPDAVGRERYRLAARLHTGADLDLDEAYAWGREELARIDAEMVAEADRVRPGASAQQALAHLDEHGEAVEGVEEVRAWLQRMMDDAIAELDGTVVDVAEPVRRVEAMIAPPGAAAAPYYTRPSLDFSRPGRTWLPTLGRDRFPTWDLISTWYHEGVPGHHLQLGQWAYRAGDLSVFQTSVGSIPATTEGWALYAERLMDELGYLRAPGARLGYLDGQRMRAVRVVIDIGMHLGLEVPAEHATHGGERWTADRAEAFFAGRSGSPAAFVHSEIERYLGWPGQAISYKLGERAWLAGRQAARDRREAAGETFDLRAWHTAALGLGSLGLDDLERELAAL